MYEDELNESDIERFWNKVEKRGEDECWLWHGNIDHEGYGNLGVSFPKNTSIKAHRLSYYLHYGEIDSKKVIMHKCDFPQCTNPNHLIMGTQKENVDDCITKGRRALQDKENNNRRILNEEKVINIKRLYETGNYTYKFLADMFGVSESAINYVINNKSWQGIGGEVNRPENKMKSNLSLNEIIEIKKMLCSKDYTQREISDILNIDKYVIKYIANNKKLNDIEEIANINNDGRITLGLKLKKEDVLKIKELLIENKLTLKEIGDLFGVTATAIQYIMLGKTWNDVCGVVERDNTALKGKKLSKGIVIEIKKMLENKNTRIKDIAKIFNISIENVYHIKQGKIWKDATL